MKSTSKMMVIAAVFLVAVAMVIMPAAARTTTDINSGDTIFLYEQNLNLTPVNSSASFTLNYYKDDDTTSGIDTTINVNDPSDFSLMEDVASKVGTKTGRYFVDNSKTEYVWIKKPAVTLKVVLASPNHSDSVAGKTVTSNSAIAYQLIASDVGGSTVNSTSGYATVNIEVTTPSGGVVKELGGVNLAGIELNKSNVYTDDVRAAIDLSAGNLDSGTYTAIAKWATPGGFDNYADDSNTVSFTLSTKKLSISANKESVVKGNAFTVTIQGDSKTNYFLYIKEKGGLGSDEYPVLASSQPGVTVNLADSTLQSMMANNSGSFANVTSGGNALTFANVNTKSDGTRTIEFQTNSTTSDETYTIKVSENKKTGAKDDDVKVKVEKGAVTITAEGSGSYYFGQEIKLSGTNTEGDYVYLFMTGPNLGDGDGVSLENTSLSVKKATTSAATGFVQEDVESDDTWEYTWNTGDLEGKTLSEGSYTVYAVSNYLDDNKEPVYKGNLADVEYATIGISLRKGFITGTTNVQTLAKGDDLKITGTAEGDPDDIYVWIFGKNYYGKNDKVQDSESVDDDGTFEYKLDDTDNLASGQYFVILQHPMAKTGSGYDVLWDSTNSVLDAPGLASSVNLLNLQASDAATAVINAIDSANVDDTYTKLTFMVEEPRIDIDTIGDKSIGSTFTITGTTNLAVGDELSVSVQSASFTATTKTESSGFTGDSGTVTVTEGADGLNKWSFDVDASNYKADQYMVKVEGIDVPDATASAQFNVVEGTPTTPVTPTESVTTVPTTQATTTVPPTTTPTQPGFGALISLIGLGAVAFLVMRRN